MATTEISWTAIVQEELADLAFAELPATMKLPALPVAVTEFMQKSKQPDTSLKELAAIVESDSGLTLELLRHVNSSALGLRHRASSVQQALALLGQRQSTIFMVTTGMQAAVRARQSKLIHQGCFWNACMQKALFSKEVARLLGADEDMAFAGGLLQDFLLPVITNDHFDDYVRYVETRNTQPQLLTDYERRQFGWDHALAGACLANRWHLPEELVCGVLMHHRGLHMLVDQRLRRTSVTAVAIASLLPDQLRQNFTGLEQLVLLQQKWPAFDLDAIVNRVDELHRKSGLPIKNDFPLARRCRSAIERQQEICDGILKMSVASA
ncbi:HDOD domain-containing protein [Rubinisphaera margarita]|uniref:HDOD domain-containing protein n=1 Tax=Rubinisphaera margarita TaxID=2909586 RepID=UPI001EE78B34|nr:HDOD domain-containing protein [Rubinisphaera margarita]MCG6157163.1 HDOD domain-containing protein [Rubinisphaera margarita]